MEYHPIFVTNKLVNYHGTSAQKPLEGLPSFYSMLFRKRHADLLHKIGRIFLSSSHFHGQKSIWGGFHTKAQILALAYHGIIEYPDEEEGDLQSVVKYT